MIIRMRSDVSVQVIRSNVIVTSLMVVVKRSWHAQDMVVEGEG